MESRPKSGRLSISDSRSAPWRDVSPFQSLNNTKQSLMMEQCPEGTSDHRQGVERSGTPANDANRRKNPDGVTEHPPSYSATPSGLPSPSMQQAGASPLPVVLSGLWPFPSALTIASHCFNCSTLYPASRSIRTTPSGPVKWPAPKTKSVGISFTASTMVGIHFLLRSA